MLNTNRIYNGAGTGAPDFPNGMPTVGGDPIVESGSNSDGNWTRWADGTQQSRGYLPETPASGWLVSGTGISYISAGEATFPSLFSEPPSVMARINDTRIGGRSAYVSSLSVSSSRAYNVYYSSPAGITSFGGNALASYEATGRWK